ncbi:MAG TPA: YrdB family protein [Ignavibacteriaceae bacterium]|nr:YrdB family protein [Ignavibacteriaceae bacterium]
MISKLKIFNLTLRGIIESGIVAGLAYWGFFTGYNLTMKLILGVGAPLLIFGFWGAYDFHNFGKLSEALRLIQELILSGFTAIVLYTTGQHFLGWALGIISIIHHLFVYLLGETLLK